MLHAAALEELLGSSGLDAPPAVAPVAGKPAHGTRVFKVLSYNIKDNPHAYFTGWSTTRCRRIGDALAARRAAGDAPDIVLLQEAFDSGAGRVRRHAGYPFEARGPHPEGTLLNGGLWVLSAHAITDTRVISYRHDTCSSFDCWATKGAMRVTLDVADLPFPVDVLTTHSQSGGKPKADAGRVRQFAAMSALLPLGETGPAFVAGDFNTDPSRPRSWAALNAAVRLPNAGADCQAAAGGCVIPPGTDPEQLQAHTNDQQFYAAGGVRYRVRPIRAERNFAPLGKLSDHLGYEVWYEISW